VFDPYKTPRIQRRFAERGPAPAAYLRTSLAMQRLRRATETAYAMFSGAMKGEFDPLELRTRDA